MKQENTLILRASYFLAGAGIGAIIGLLFTPKSGRELRKDISTRAKQGMDLVSKKTSNVLQEGMDSAHELIDIGKDVIANQKMIFENALESSKQAYHDKKDEMDLEKMDKAKSATATMGTQIDR